MAKVKKHPIPKKRRILNERKWVESILSKKILNDFKQKESGIFLYFFIFSIDSLKGLEKAIESVFSACRYSEVCGASD